MRSHSPPCTLGNSHLFPADAQDCYVGPPAYGKNDPVALNMQDGRTDGERVAGTELTAACIQRFTRCLTPTRQKAGQRVLFMVGDSHCAHLVPGVRRAVGNRLEVRWASYICDPGGFLPHATTGTCRQASDLFRQLLLQNMRPGDIVLVAHLGTKFMVRPGHAPDALTCGCTATTPQITGMVNFLRAFHAEMTRLVHNTSLVIMGDPPMLPQEGALCLTQPSNCVRKKANELAPVEDAYRALSRESPSIHFFQPHDLFCTVTQCQAQVPGTTTFAYVDVHHLTTAGSMYLWPYLCSWFEGAAFFSS